MAPDATPTTPTPAPAAAPTSTPSLGGLANPGALQVDPSAVAGNQAKLEAGAADVLSARAAQGNTPPPPAKHATLLRMVEGLGVALSTGAQAYTTHGEKGGAPAAQEYYANKQNQEIQAQDAKTRQNITALNLMRDTMIQHQNIQRYDLENQKAQQELTQGKQTLEAGKQALTKGDIEIKNLTGLSSDDYNAVTSGKGTAAMAASVTSTAQQQIDAFSTLKNNPAYLKLQADIAKPNPDPAQQAKTLTDDMGALNRAKTLTTQGTAAEIQAGEAAAKAPLTQEQADAANGRLQERWNQLNPDKPMPDSFKTKAGMSSAERDKIESSMDRMEQASVQQGAVAPTGDMSKTGEAYIATIPMADRATIRAIGQGREPMPPPGSRSPGARKILSELNQAYPNITASDFPTFLKARENFTSGQIGTGINSYNTSINHLAQMWDTVQSASAIDLNNPTSPARQKLQQDENFVSMELAKAVSNGQMTQTEAEEMKNSIKGSIFGVKGKDKYSTQIQNALGLLNGKLDAYQNQWHTATKNVSGAGDFPVLSPDAQANVARIGKTPQTHVFDSKAWAAANPGKDVNAAVAAAKQQGYEVR
jgi:hypothetical protein